MSGPVAAAEILLDVAGLDVESRSRGLARTIVSDVNLRVRRGEAIGVVGESGSGKSMTARAIVGLLPRGLEARGSVLFRGTDLLSLSGRHLRRVRGTGISLILQDPFTMLNPSMRARHQVEETISEKSSGAGSHRRLEGERRLAEVGINDPEIASRYPFQLSGGMQQRVGLAAALAADCDLLIADEPSTALDVTTQKEILMLLRRLQMARGMGLILITHNLRVAFSTCDRVYVMYAGSVLEVGPAAELESEPLHPYTNGLLMAEPPADRRLVKLSGLPGSLPSADSVAGVCGFSPRCVWSAEECVAKKPELRQVAENRQTACIRIDEIRSTMRRTRMAADVREHELVLLPSQPILVQIRGLSKEFGAARHAFRALNDISLDIAEGESVGVVGETGAGKTTLARCLVGLETPTQGVITIGGINASNYSTLRRKDRQRLRQLVQMVFQDPYSTLNPSHTVGETLIEAVGMRIPRPPNPLGEMHELMRRVGLPLVLANRRPAALSGGERQRVAIARALAVRPKVLVCDEPVSALDVSVQAQILNLFKQVHEELGITYLFITHDLAVARQVSDRIFVLSRGEVVESGAATQILDRPQHPYTKRLVEAIPRSDSSWLGVGG